MRGPLEIIYLSPKAISCSKRFAESRHGGQLWLANKTVACQINCPSGRRGMDHSPLALARQLVGKLRTVAMLKA